MDASKIKKYAIGGSGFIFAVTLVVFAMAVAQRDARTKDPTNPTSEVSYSNQAAEGISHDPDSVEGAWPPPVVRSNDSELGDPPALPAVSSLADLSGAVLPSTASLSDPASLPDAASLPDGIASEPSLNASEFAEPPALGSIANLSEITSTDLPVSGEGDSAGPTPLPALGALSAPPQLPSTLPSEQDFAPKPNEGSSLPPLLERQGGASVPNSFPPIDAPPSAEGSPSETGVSALDATHSPFSSAPPPISSPSAPSSDGFAGSGSGLPESSAPAPGVQSPVAPNAIAAPSLSSPPSLSAPQSLSAPPSLQSPVASDPAFGAPRASGPPVSSGLPDVSPSRAPLNAAALSSAALSSAGAAALLSSAAPGVRQLEGAQNPSLEIQKRAPSEVQVGVPATFTLVVRNVGTASAFDVAVHDSVPKGAKLVRTTPSAQVDAEGKILWKLGEMAAGSEQVLTLDLTPETEGELGSVASVTFAAQASVRTMSTQPKLALKQSVGGTVLGGEVASIVIEVSNVGTGTARDVELEEDVPPNMRHASGVSTLGLTIGDLAPGESEKVVIELTGVSAGQAVNRVRAIASNNTSSESEATIQVVLPKLVVNLEGPRLRYLERQATYRASITNSGTAIAHDIELLLHLPRGMEYTSAANEGTYLREQHAVIWSLAELAAGATVNTEVTLLPVQEGEFSLRMQCDAVGVQAESIDKKVHVEGQSELAFSIEDDNDPIETDGLTTYIIKITNAGTRIDSNVQLVFEVPEGSNTEQVHAPVNHQPSQRTIVFAPIPKMQPKDTQIYRIAVRHSQEGTIVARAQLKSDNRPVPVIKEESTHVYRDN